MDFLYFLSYHINEVELFSIMNAVAFDKTMSNCIKQSRSFGNFALIIQAKICQHFVIQMQHVVSHSKITVLLFLSNIIGFSAFCQCQYIFTYLGTVILCFYSSYPFFFKPLGTVAVGILPLRKSHDFVV